MRDHGSRDTIALAGWLFADLLLGLGLLFFVAESRGTPPVPTPTITPTPTRTYTPTPTGTRYPTYTPYPTFTLIYTYTPYPTFTPLPPNLTYTPYPTFTPVPPEWTYTPYPTYTQPPPLLTFTPLPTYTPVPTSNLALNRTPYTLNLNIRGSDLRGQIRTCLSRFNGIAQAGVALLFGSSPNPTTGNAFAKQADDAMRAEFPVIFEKAVSKDYHFISGAGETGQVTAEIYFIGDTGDLFSPDDASCTP